MKTKFVKRILNYLFWINFCFASHIFCHPSIKSFKKFRDAFSHSPINCHSISVITTNDPTLSIIPAFLDIITNVENYCSIRTWTSVKWGESGVSNWHCQWPWYHLHCTCTECSTCIQILVHANLFSSLWIGFKASPCSEKHSVNFLKHCGSLSNWDWIYFRFVVHFILILIAWQKFFAHVLNFSYKGTKKATYDFLLPNIQ